jgi:serine O-acetyltransferase
VSELREVRVASLDNRKRRDNPPKLPSRKTLIKIVEDLSAALFPNRLGTPDINDEGIDYFVGHTLDIALRELLTQVKLELHFSSGLETLTDVLGEEAVHLVQQFAHQLPAVRLLLDTDIRSSIRR